MRNTATAAFVSLGLIWGSNFIFMKWASETITAGQVTFLRVLFGFLPIVVYAAVRRVLERRHLRHVHHFFVMSVLATSVYYFAYAAGTALLPSGIAGALSGAIPLFSFVAAALFLRSERVTPTRLLGVLIGFGGVLLIARPWVTDGDLDMTGVVCMLLGSASVGLSFVYAKRFLVGLDIPGAALTTYQIGLGLLTLAVVTDYDGITAIGEDPRALLALVLGLGLLGTGVAYILYYFIVDRLGAITASSATYIPPVVALAIGWLLVGEPLDVLDAAAVLLILVGVMVLRLGGRQAARRPCRTPPTRPRRDLRPPWLEGGDEVAGGAADADEGGRRGAGPVAVPDEVQPRLVDRLRPEDGEVPVGVPQPERREVPELGPEPGAPDDGVRRLLPAVGPRDAVAGDPLEHRLGPQRAALPGLAYDGHHHDVPQGGHPAGVRCLRSRGRAVGRWPP